MKTMLLFIMILLLGMPTSAPAPAMQVESYDLEVFFNLPEDIQPIEEPQLVEYSIYEYIIDQCKELGINYNFAMSILQSENTVADPNPKPNQNRNGTKDLGMWQLNSNYIEWFCQKFWHNEHEFDVENPFDNTYVALRIIKWLFKQINNSNLIEQYPDTEWLVAVAYNAGIGRLLSVTNGNPLPNSSIAYANKTVNYRNNNFPSYFISGLTSTVISV